MLPSYYYVIPEHVFRLGNATGPRFDNVRSNDVDTFKINEVTVVIANDKGISVFDREGINHAPFTGWVWKLSSGTPLPMGLRLIKDKPHHYGIGPTMNMPLDKYKGLLEELALRAERVLKKPGSIAI